MNRKEKGIATIVTLAIIVGSFIVGLAFEHFVREKNHPVEQVVEKVLKEYGIDYDFSKNKKIKTHES